MSEKIEWEVVDAPSADNTQQYSQQHTQQDARQQAGKAMETMLGRWWKWKVAGTAVVTLLMLAFFATLTGALVLLFAAGTLLSVGLRKLKQWLGYGKEGASPMKY